MASQTACSSSSSSSSTSESSAIDTIVPPWLELPDYLTEKILERLPPSGYISFGAVCRKWLSIIENHRLCYAPLSPPLLNLPWFIPSTPISEGEETISCYAPFEQKYYNIHLPDRDTGSEGYYCSLPLPNGWLVVDQRYRAFDFTLWNPVSGESIKLPQAWSSLVLDYKMAIAPFPDWSIFALTQDKWNKEMYIIRPDQDNWIELENPVYRMGMHENDLFEETCVTFWNGKFYCFFLSKGLMMFDPLEGKIPTIEFLEMDQSQLPPLRSGWEDDYWVKLELFLVDCNGKLLLVMEHFEYDRDFVGRELVGFKVFEADIADKRWVRVDCLGSDHVLFIYRTLAASLLASDLGVKANCIYCPDPSKEGESRPWKVFDMSVEMVTEVSSLPNPPPASNHLMFVPRLY